jgi:chaperonin cofactor prefoldin
MATKKAASKVDETGPLREQIERLQKELAGVTVERDQLRSRVKQLEADLAARMPVDPARQVPGAGHAA